MEERTENIFKRVIIVLVIAIVFLYSTIISLGYMEKEEMCRDRGYDGYHRDTMDNIDICYKKGDWNINEGEYDYKFHKVNLGID